MCISCLSFCLFCVCVSMDILMLISDFGESVTQLNVLLSTNTLLNTSYVFKTTSRTFKLLVYTEGLVAV